MHVASMTFDEIVSWEKEESISPLLRTSPLKPRRKGVEFQGNNLYVKFLHVQCVDDHFDVLDYWKYEDVYGGGCFDVGGSFTGFDSIDERVGYGDRSLPGLRKKVKTCVIHDEGVDRKRKKTLVNGGNTGKEKVFEDVDADRKTKRTLVNRGNKGKEKLCMDDGMCRKGNKAIVTIYKRARVNEKAKMVEDVGAVKTRRERGVVIGDSGFNNVGGKEEVSSMSMWYWLRLVIGKLLPPSGNLHKWGFTTTLAVLITGASQRRQHGKSKPIPLVLAGSWERIPIPNYLITPNN
uniref:Uncharacterized protein n=1 Tax=Tanacetum cinerariifolium TaxID=118510 RepID=A0A6L2J5D4_TANCI|nr:hypothetical protein [Tanacetum cinerariifolium]